LASFFTFLVSSESESNTDEDEEDEDEEDEDEEDEDSLSSPFMRTSCSCIDEVKPGTAKSGGMAETPLSSCILSRWLAGAAERNQANRGGIARSHEAQLSSQWRGLVHAQAWLET
jgi:hypothetical protein